MNTRPFDSSIRLAPSYMDGAMIAAAAVPDSVLVYVGAACIQEHFHNTFSQADWGQDLVSDGPRSRLILTFSDLTAGVLGTSRAVETAVQRAREVLGPSIVFLAELSRVTIAGEDLAGLAQDLTARFEVPVVALTGPSLARDHETAYRSALNGLARSLPDRAFDGGLIPRSAAVIGYLYERNEGDHRANVSLLERMLRQAGLSPVATWLSHAPYAALAQAARASLLLALPHGVEAARIIASRSGAQVVEVQLPIGVEGTRRFHEQVLNAAGAADRPEDLVQQELAGSGREVLRAVFERLAGRRVALAALREWRHGLVRMMQEDFGMDVAVHGCRGRLPDAENPEAPGSQDLDRDHDPSVRSWNHQVERAMKAAGLHLIVGSSWERNALRGPAATIPFCEFGYPCFRSHALTERPSLGVAGMLAWADRLSDLIAGSRGLTV